MEETSSIRNFFVASFSKSEEGISSQLTSCGHPVSRTGSSSEGSVADWCSTSTVSDRWSIAGASTVSHNSFDDNIPKKSVVKSGCKLFKKCFGLGGKKV